MLATALFWLDGGVCSQDPAHSLVVAGRVLPLCARDLGLFGGFLLMSLVPLRARRASLLWLLGIVPMTVDGLNSLAADALYPGNNALRLASGLLAGISLAVLLAPRLGRALLPVAALIGGAALLRPYDAAALLATLAVLSLLAAANLLLRPDLRLAWLLALPELAGLALLKHAALFALRP